MKTNPIVRQKLTYKKFLDAMVLSKMPMDLIIDKLRENNLLPFPNNIEEEYRHILNEYKAQFGTDIIDYPSQIKTMMAYLQNLPGSGPYIKPTFEILSDAVIRRWLNAMAMANIAPDLSYVLVGGKTDKIYEEGVFLNYNYFFFNLDGFSAKDRNDIYLAETNSSLKEMYETALRYDKDELLWKLGFTPDIPVEQLVKIVAIESVMRFKKTKDEDKAARLGALVLKATEKLREFDDEKKKVLENVAGFNIKILSEKPSIKLITELEDSLE